MKKTLVILLAVTMVLASCNKPNLNVKLKTENDSISYLMGLYYARHAKNTDLENLNAAAVAKAFGDVFSKDSIAFTEEQVQMKLNAYFMQMQQKASVKVKADGEKFLEENKKKSGVITTPSGLQYQVIKEGTGPQPDSTDIVSVHYAGTLINGEEFDSSIKRGTPEKFGVTGVIPGWTEALLKMKVGSKWKLVIPSNLAYGERGAGRQIKPNATLVFEMELLNIEPKAAPAKDQPMK